VLGVGAVTPAELTDDDGAHLIQTKEEQNEFTQFLCDLLHEYGIRYKEIDGEQVIKEPPPSAFACMLLPSDCDSQLEVIQSQHRNWFCTV